jgi:thymidylate synthase (FAD)
LDVQLVDVFGSDDRICDAARVSFSKAASNYTPEQNQKLIQYLATHNHWSPFAHVVITMKEKVPIFVARQRFKHRIGFEYNEVSRRYVDDTPEFFVPDVWRKRAENKKQGSSDEVITHIQEPNGDSYEINFEYEGLLQHVMELYTDMIQSGVAPEQARMVLPQSMMTEYIVTGSLAAWARAYKLRSDEHSQKEIRDLAEEWQKIIGGIKELEHSWRALTI